jgi:ABC-type lipoprotein export system ATPase subunit
VVACDDLRLAYAGAGMAVQALSGVTLAAEPGQMLAIRGESGSGKTTLLHALGLLLRPDAGLVWIDGRDCAALSERERSDLRRASIGFMFQSFHLLPQLTAVQNVALAGQNPRRTVPRAEELLVGLRLGDRIQHRPGQLSAGEQQRVALARALVNRPRLLLADEPTGNLDPDNESRILQLLAEQAAGGAAVVIVTHSGAVVARCTSTVTMSRGRLLPERAAT